MKVHFTSSRSALTLIEVLAIVGALMVLLALLLPALRPAQTGSRRYCTNQLRQLGNSFNTWSADHLNRLPMQVSTNDGGTMELVESGGVVPHLRVLSNLGGSPLLLLCPQDSKRSAATNFEADFTANKISYFVGVDATLNNGQMFLSGDRNITNGTPVRHGILGLTTNYPAGWTSEIHQSLGNILFVDGHVEGLGEFELRGAITVTGLATNRLAIP